MSLNTLERGPEVVPADALLVLGRGISEDGVLSETSRLRAEMAVDLARVAMPNVIVFSGGHSWVQEREGSKVPSEGEAMRKVAIAYLGEASLGSTALLAEEKSHSTVENMVNSKPLLNLAPGQRLDILTDELHDKEGRVTYLANLIYPDQKVRVITSVPNTVEQGAEAEEKKATMMTKLFMRGVRPGNDKAAMRHQHALEKANSFYRSLLGAKKWVSTHLLGGKKDKPDPNSMARTGGGRR